MKNNYQLSDNWLNIDKLKLEARLLPIKNKNQSNDNCLLTD
jgi:hypothetical protein